MTPAVGVPVDPPHIGQIFVGFEPAFGFKPSAVCLQRPPASPGGSAGRPGPACSEQGLNGAGTCVQDGVWHGHCCWLWSRCPARVSCVDVV